VEIIFRRSHPFANSSVRRRRWRKRSEKRRRRTSKKKFENGSTRSQNRSINWQLACTFGYNTLCWRNIRNPARWLQLANAVAMMLSSAMAGFGRRTRSSCGQKLSDSWMNNSRTNSVIKVHWQRYADAMDAMKRRRQHRQFDRGAKGQSESRIGLSVNELDIVSARGKGDVLSPPIARWGQSTLDLRPRRSRSTTQCIH